jgi:hypothetical protein
MQATRRHLKQAVAELGVKKPLVAYVGVASNDDAGFHKMLASAFGAGARLEMVSLARKNASVARARALLSDSDAVFISGGDVEHGMNLLRERGVDDDLRKLSAGGKPFIGISAGSIMSCQSWVRFPDDDDARAEPFECLGLAPVHMDAHSEDDGWSELRVLVKLLAKRGTGVIGHGVPSKGYLRVDVSGARTRLTAFGAPIARIGARRGDAVDKSPLAPKS